MIRTLQGQAGTSRCAVVIGIDNPGILATLESAASGAAEVADWLAAEGYDVTLLSDGDHNPVSAADVFAAIKAFVDKQTYDVLVLYFSGHGFRSPAVRDLWLLSGASTNPQASINLDASVELARDSGIANVVVISDACRSQPVGFGTMHRGAEIFPIRVGSVSSSTIDHILSTAPGALSWEAVLDASGRKRSLLTHCLRSVYATPVDGVARDITVDGVTKKVVTNRMLRKVIPVAMKEAIKAAKLSNVKQTPDLIIPSDDEFFIATVKASGPSLGIPESIATEAPVAVAGADMNEWLSISPPTPATIGAQTRALKQRSERFTVADVTVGDIAKFETSTGIAVRGARVRAVSAMGGIPAEPLPHDVASVAGSVVRVGNAFNVPQAATIAVQFEDGSGTLVAALRGFIAHVAVGKTGIYSVRYVPSSNSDFFYPYVQDRDIIDARHAQIASLAQDGVLDVPQLEMAQSMAEMFRLRKSLDPALGIYSAYLYRMAGWRGSRADRSSLEDVSEIDDILSEQFGVSLFDIALLAHRIGPDGRRTGGVRSSAHRQNLQVVPCCPMLTQGWSLLGSRSVVLPPVLADAWTDIAPSLWTTFSPSRMDLILAAIDRGELQ